MLQKIQIATFVTTKGQELTNINLTYEVFGKPLHTAPVVMVNHALTGNSTVCGENGWWNGLVGKGKCINTEKYTVLAFNIPGNGYQEADLFDDYKVFTARDIASVFAKGLKVLEVKQLYAVIGGSVGGGIAWELAALEPTLIQHLIPIATDWKSTDWLKANCLIQEQILNNSSRPLHDARLHAMLIYRTPESFKQKFDRSYNEEKNMFNVESWLFHHGQKLEKRFELAAYKQVNHILANIDITKERESLETVVSNIKSQIHIISVDSDQFFTAAEDQLTFERLQKINKDITLGTISSPHGHDAFLIEFDQLSALLGPIF